MVMGRWLVLRRVGVVFAKVFGTEHTWEWSLVKRLVVTTVENVHWKDFGNRAGEMGRWY